MSIDVKGLMFGTEAYDVFSQLHRVLQKTISQNETLPYKEILGALNLLGYELQPADRNKIASLKEYPFGWSQKIVALNTNDPIGYIFFFSHENPISKDSGVLVVEGVPPGPEKNR